MALRYEMKDREHPDWRGQRAGTEERALWLLSTAVPRSRFFILDRETGEELGTPSFEFQVEPGN